MTVLEFEKPIVELETKIEELKNFGSDKNINLGPEEKKLEQKLDKMKNELSILRAQKESFAKRLKHLLESQIELIRVLEIDDFMAGKSPKEDSRGDSRTD